MHFPAPFRRPACRPAFTPSPGLDSRMRKMVITCWSAKGGAGTTVVAAAIALTLSRSTRGPVDLFPRHGEIVGPLVGSSGGVLLVDAAGEAAAVLGMPEPDGPGLGDWFEAGADAPPDGLARLEVEVAEGLTLIPRGSPLPSRPADVGRAELLGAVLAADPRPVVIDCGCLGPPSDDGDGVATTLAASAPASLLVTRSCYLALRRAAALDLRPRGVVLVQEPGRALGADDVVAVLGRPVVASIPWDASIGRAVDSGLLGSRLPRVLARPLVRA